MRGQDEEEGGGRMSQQVAGRGSMWGRGGGGGSAHRYLGEEAGIGSGEGGGGEGGWVGACPRAKDRYRPRGRSGLQVPIPVRGRPRAGAETSGKTNSWNRPPREDRATI